MPRVHALCLDPAIAGSMFYVMGLVLGREFWDPSLPELVSADRTQIFESLNATIAAIHRIDPEALASSISGDAANIGPRLRHWRSGL